MTDEQYQNWLLANGAFRTILIHATANVGGVETTLKLSTTPYSHSGVTYLPYIQSGVSFTEAVNLDGTPSLGVGDIAIENGSGNLDEWLDYVWANRQLTAYLGDVRWPFSDFRIIFDGVIRDIASVSPTELSLTLLNKLDRLNSPAIEAKLGGSTQNKDRLIPHVLGEVHNVEPLLEDNDLTYIVHGGGAMEAIIEARDNGAPRTVTETLATGRIQFTDFNTVGQVTVSAQGAKPGGVYTNKIADLVEVLVTEYGPVDTRFTSLEIDSDNFDDFNTAYPQPVGVYLQDETTVLGHAQALAASVGAQVTCSAVGQLRLVPLRIPAPGTGRVILPQDMHDGSFQMSERVPVKAGCKLAYCKNWTVQTSGLAAGLPVESTDLFAQEWLTETHVDSGVAALYRLTTSPVQEDTLLLATADAIAEAERRRNMFMVPRTIYTFTGFRHLLDLSLGDTILCRFPRYGLDAGKSGIVISLERNWIDGAISVGVLI